MSQPITDHSAPEQSKIVFPEPGRIIKMPWVHSFLGVLMGVLLYKVPRFIAFFPVMGLGAMIYYLARTQQLKGYKHHLRAMFTVSWVRMWSLLLLWMGLSCFWAIFSGEAILAFIKMLFFSSIFLCLWSGRHFCTDALNQGVGRWSAAVSMTFLVGLNIDYLFDLSFLKLLKSGVSPYHNYKVLTLFFFFLAPSYGWMVHRFSAVGRTLILGLMFIDLWMMLHGNNATLSKTGASFFNGFVITMGCFIGWGVAYCVKGRLLFIPLALGLFITGLTAPFVLNHYTASEINQTLQKAGIAFLKHSHVHRMHIYLHAAEAIMKKPFLGYGMEVCKSNHLKRTAQVTCPENQTTYTAPTLVHHPHNFFLQWWLELGAVGALLFLILVFKGIMALPRSTIFQTTQSLFLAIPLICIGLVSFGFWQTWLLGGGIFSIFLTAIMRTPLPTSKK